MIDNDEQDTDSNLNHAGEKPNDTKAALELQKETEKELAKYRKPFEKPAKEYDDAYYGKQHRTGEDQKTIKNHIFKIVEGEVPILTDSMAGTTLTAHSQDRQVDADNLNHAITYVHQDNNLLILLPTVVRASLRSFPGYIYTYYDADAENGDGKIIEKQLDWEQVYLDGNVSMIEDSEKAVIKIPTRRAALARTWPEFADKIMKTNAESGINGKDDNYEARDVSGLSNETGKPKKHKAKDIVDYKETWIKSYDLEPIDSEETQEEIDKEHAQMLAGEPPDIHKWEDHPAHEKAHQAGIDEVLGQLQLPPGTTFDQAQEAVGQMIQQNPQAEPQLQQLILALKLGFDHLEAHGHMKELNPKGQKPKYEDGWRLIKSVQDIILYDGPNPCQSGMIPIIPFYAYKDETIYGFGEIKNILDAQRTLNEVDNKEFKNLKRCADSGWIADHESGVTAENLTDEAGIVVIKAAGTEVQRLPPGEVSPQLGNRKVTDQMFMENASGINEESQGNTSNSMSGVAIEKLQTQAVGRIRLKDRGIQYYSMKRLSQLVGALILYHWSEEKQFRLRDENSNVNDIVFDPLTMRDLKYSVDVSPGSMAGINKDAMNSFFLQMYQAQIITGEDFLTVADFPKRQILLKKMQERNLQAQQLQAQQAEQQAQIAQAQQEYEQKINGLETENQKLKIESGLDKKLNEIKTATHIQKQQAVENDQADKQGNM